jgi:hypothetical protein
VILQEQKSGLIKQEHWGHLYKMKKYLLLLTLFISSCNKNETLKIDKYFDLKKYFTAEADRLQKQELRLKKDLLKGGNSETVIIDSVNWTKTLASFTSCDINKPSWINSYTIDSIRSDNTLLLMYRAKEQTLIIQKLEIVLTNDKVSSINIDKSRTNFYYTSTENYQYTPLGFTMKGKQKVLLMDEVNYIIQGKFIP